MSFYLLLFLIIYLINHINCKASIIRYSIQKVSLDILNEEEEDINKTKTNFLNFSDSFSKNIKLASEISKNVFIKSLDQFDAYQPSLEYINNYYLCKYAEKSNCIFAVNVEKVIYVYFNKILDTLFSKPFRHK